MAMAQLADVHVTVTSHCHSRRTRPSSGLHQVPCHIMVMTTAEEGRLLDQTVRHHRQQTINWSVNPAQDAFYPTSRGPGAVNLESAAEPEDLLCSADQ